MVVTINLLYYMRRFIIFSTQTTKKGFCVKKKCAILSDIHGNLEAFEAVLKDLKNKNIDRIIILGDTVGYGPNPKECWEKANKVADFVLIGNHEYEILHPGDDLMNPTAKEAINWTGKQVEELASWKKLQQDFNKKGANKLSRKKEKNALFVHASPRDSIMEYVCPEEEHFYIAFHRQIDNLLMNFLGLFEENHCFCGHTHVPSILTSYHNRLLFKKASSWNTKITFIGSKAIFFVPSKKTYIAGISNKKMIINPGSVGQPRDGSRRASYAIYDGNSISFFRLNYDWKKTQKKLLETSMRKSVKKFLAERLSRGF